jgi:hypothetical protein
MNIEQEIKTEELLNSLYYVFMNDISVEEYGKMGIELQASVMLKDIAEMYGIVGYIKSFKMFLTLYINNYAKLVSILKIN